MLFVAIIVVVILVLVVHAIVVLASTVIVVVLQGCATLAHLVANKFRDEVHVFLSTCEREAMTNFFLSADELTGFWRHTLVKLSRRCV
jgi:hypothetical protein